MSGPTMSLPIFYINLARDTERRQKLEAELARQGLQGTRFEAVWWANLGEAEQKQLYSAELNKHQFHASLVNGETRDRLGVGRRVTARRAGGLLRWLDGRDTARGGSGRGTRT